MARRGVALRCAAAVVALLLAAVVGGAFGRRVVADANKGSLSAMVRERFAPYFADSFLPDEVKRFLHPEPEVSETALYNVPNLPDDASEADQLLFQIDALQKRLNATVAELGALRALRGKEERDVMEAYFAFDDAGKAHLHAYFTHNKKTMGSTFEDHSRQDIGSLMDLIETRDVLVAALDKHKAAAQLLLDGALLLYDQEQLLERNKELLQVRIGYLQVRLTSLPLAFASLEKEEEEEEEKAKKGEEEKHEEGGEGGGAKHEGEAGGHAGAAAEAKTAAAGGASKDAHH